MKCIGHEPIMGQSNIQDGIICRRCGSFIFYDKKTDEYVTDQPVAFNPVQFIKAQQDDPKSVEENMKDLGASDESFAYAMHIIKAQQETLRKLKVKRVAAVPEMSKMAKTIQCQRDELHRFSERENNHRFCTHIRSFRRK